MIVESIEFDSYVRLPNPHGRQQYAHREKFEFAADQRGVMLTCKLKNLMVLVPWSRISAVHYAPNVDMSTKPGPVKAK